MASWHGGFCHAPPRPQRGTSPRATFSHCNDTAGGVGVTGLGRDGEGELGSFAGLAFDPDAATVDLDQLLGNGQAQTGTAG